MKRLSRVALIGLMMFFVASSLYSDVAPIKVPVKGTSGLSPVLDAMSKVVFLGVRSADFRKEMIGGKWNLLCDIRLDYENQNEYKLVISRLQSIFLCIPYDAPIFKVDPDSFSMVYHDFLDRDDDVLKMEDLTAAYKPYYTGVLIYPKDALRKSFVFEPGKNTATMTFVIGPYYSDRLENGNLNEISATMERMLRISNVINGVNKDKAKLVILSKGKPNYFPNEGVTVPLPEARVAVVMERAPNDYLLLNKFALKRAER